MAVDTTHREYDLAAPQWKKCRDATAGQEAVHGEGVQYLPKLAKQTADEYNAYKKRALYYNATGRTVDGLSGLIFRRPPTSDIAESIAYVETDVDTSGTPLLAFAEAMVEELIQVGRIGLLVDYPPLQGVRTKADEMAANGRPYIKTYTAESILNWRVERVNNRNELSLLVLKECRVVSEDGFKQEEVPVWRVLRLVAGVYQVELWEKTKTANGGEEFIQVDLYTPTMGSKPIAFIPFLICGPMGVSATVAKPPIIDLANVNLSHYMTTADYEHGLHFTGLPTPVVYGHTFDTGEEFALGSTSVRAFPDPQAKAEFLEFQGTGLTQLSKRLEEKEGMMAALGARMLANEKRQAEAAETAAIHRAGENSVLSSLANAASAALSKALTWCVQWAGGTGESKVELNTDYLPAGMTAQELTSLVGAWQTGAISRETLYDNLQRGEIAQQGVSFEDEQGRLDAEGPPLGGMGADVALATDQLNAAISLHEKHMNGTAPTTGKAGDASQQKMMDQMTAALQALSGDPAGSMKGM